MERFLARLHQSEHREHFILKGGSLLARYIDLGRETRDLDFLVAQMANVMKSVSDVLDRICRIDLDDAFSFERVKISPVAHSHMHDTGAQVTLLARLGKTRTHLQIDLGFGDIVEPVDHSIVLTSKRKGPILIGIAKGLAPLPGFGAEPQERKRKLGKQIENSPRKLARKNLG